MSIVLLSLLLVTACNAPITPGIAVSPAVTGTPAATTAPATGAPATTAPATPAATGLPPTGVPATTAPTPAATGPLTVTTIHMLDATHGWAIGGVADPGDRVLVTADGAQTWRDVTPPEPALGTPSTPAAIGFFPNTTGAWVAYYTRPGAGDPASFERVVWRTSDGGATWAASAPLARGNADEGYFLSHLLFAADGRTGWLLAHVGAGMNHDYFMLYRSTDGGATWAIAVDPAADTTGIQSCVKTGMAFGDAQTGWLSIDCNGVAEGLRLGFTTDGGATWALRDLPAPAGDPAYFTGKACGARAPQLFTAQSGVLAVSCSPAGAPDKPESFLYRTSDGGATWTARPAASGDALFLDAQRGWSLGRAIAWTADGGAGWEPRATVDWAGQFSFVDEQHGWAVARLNNAVALVQTSDGGKTWTILP